MPGYPPQPAERAAPRAELLARLLSLRVAAMLWRNTVVGSGVFVIGLGVTYLLVERGHVDKALAGGFGFLVANSLHYLLGRAWIFRGTERGAASGYALFLANAVIGFAITVQLYTWALAYLPLHYLVSRILVSVVAGLVMFVLNAVFNFRQV